MRARQITVKTGRGGAEIRREETLDAPLLSIGRSTTNLIQLSGLGVGLHHAEIFEAEGGHYIRGIEGNEIFVNGIAVVETRLGPEDVVRIQQHEMRMRQAGGDADLEFELVELERSGNALQELNKRTRAGIDSGWLTQRKLAWFLVIAILLAFAWAPFFAGYLEASWSSGPMARVHSGIAEDCTSCHVTPFEPVTDKACLQCHAEVGEHVDETHPHIEIRCAYCHVEHNGALGLTSLDQSTCVACHGEGVAPEGLQPASDFGVHHPHFSVTLNSPENGTRGRFALSDDPREKPGILFNHWRHTTEGVVDSVTGQERPLECTECHELEPGGGGMETISFERHCQECHSLGFDTGAGERQALHGDPVAMRQSLREFFAWLELEKVRQEVLLAEPAPTLRRGRPGASLTPERRREIAQNVEDRVERASHFLMRDTQGGVCVGCHEVLRGEALDGGDAIADVSIPDRWMTRSVFDHWAHRGSECTDCHTSVAGPSEVRSEDAGHIALPDLETCQDCHAGGHASEPYVPSDCVMCHEFHLLGKSP